MAIADAAADDQLATEPVETAREARRHERSESEAR
jgi:hypothetical protein